MKKCQLCGKKTKKDYPLCKNCYEQFLEGEIIQCEECMTFHYINEACPTCKKYYLLPVSGFDNCILCGAKSKGYAFCKDCWKQFNDEELLEKLNYYINKDKVTVEEIDDYRKNYPAIFHCKDGHYVRSAYEKIIDDTLYDNKIRHEYERKYKAVDGNTYYPDFYITDFNLFIEYFGVNENQRKNIYKQEVFIKDKIYNFAFIWPDKRGILDETIIEIIDELKNRQK